MKTLPVFQGVLEQKFAKQILSENVRAARIGHAYLFMGPAGVGKRITALRFAAAVLCRYQGCGQCLDCQRVLDLQHPDVRLLQVEERTLKVSHIRQLGQDIIIGPHSGAFKFFVINEADKMTAAAQNALLKVLEEPPEYACLILVVDDISQILPTVQSRCVPVRFGPLSPDVVERELIHRGVTADLARAASLLSHGSLGQALQLAQETDLAAVERTAAEIISAVVEGDQYHLLQLARALSEQRQSVPQVLDYLELVLRDAIIARVGASGALGIGKLAVPLSLARLKRGCKMVIEGKMALNRYQNTRLVVETLLLTL